MTQAQRVLTIFIKLTKKQKLCTKLLCVEFQESERNIQRDLKLIKDVLGTSMVMVERGCYQLLDSDMFSTLLKEQKAKELKSFFELLAMLDSKSLQFLEKKEFSFLSEIKKEVREVYTVFDNPIEELKDISFLEELKVAIKQRRYCDIIYHEKEPRELKDIKPQKILYAKNNWYLVAMTKNYKINDGFKRFRINFIDEFKLQNKTFHRDIQVEKNIETMQSLFQNFNRENYTVKVRVDSEVARYFRVKKYLSSQKIIDEIDGNLILSFEINDDMELIPLIRQWIPYLKVISPISLQNKIKTEIKNYLSDL